MENLFEKHKDKIVVTEVISHFVGRDQLDELERQATNKDLLYYGLAIQGSSKE